MNRRRTMQKEKNLMLEEARGVLKKEEILPLLESFRKSAEYKQIISSAYRELMEELSDIQAKVTEKEYTEKLYEEDVYDNIILRLAAISKAINIPKVSIDKKAEKPLFETITELSTKGTNESIVEKTILKMLMSVEMIVII